MEKEFDALRDEFGFINLDEFKIVKTEQSRRMLLENNGKLYYYKSVDSEHIYYELIPDFRLFHLILPNHY